MELRDRTYITLPNEENKENDQLGQNGQNVIGTGYNPQQKPPNLDLARKHGKANRVYLARSQDNNVEEQEVCPCCGLPVEGELIPLTADLDKLQHVGIFYVLYFKAIKYFIALAFMMFCVSGFYNLITNLYAEESSYCDSYENEDTRLECTQGFIVNSSFFPLGREDEGKVKTQGILNFITILLIIIFTQYMMYQLTKYKKKAESKTLKASDYTVCVYNMPSEANDEDFIQWLQDFGTAEQPVRVQRVIWPYMKNDHTKRCPFAFVSFEEVAHARHIQAVFKYMMSKCDEKSYFLGKLVGVQRAPEPSAVSWEYLRSGTGILFVFCVALAGVGLLAILFLLLIQLNLLKTQAKDRLQEESSILQIFPIIIPVFTLIINDFLAFLLTFVVRISRSSTYTIYFEQFIIIYILITVLNLSCAPFCADAGILTFGDGVFKNENIGPVEFAHNSFWVILVNSLITPFLPLLDASYLYKLYRRFFKSPELTQEEAHSLFEGATMNPTTRLASIFGLICMTCTYAFAMPIVIIFTIISLTLCYWVDKYLLLRRQQLPKQITSNSLIETGLYAKSVLPVFFSIANAFITHSIPIPDLSAKLNLLAILIGFFSAFVPLSSLIEKIFPIDYQTTETKTFSEAKPHFATDYDSETVMQQSTRSNSDQESSVELT